MIEALPRHPGGDPLGVARRIVAFLGEARRSLDLALYDIRLPGDRNEVRDRATGERQEVPVADAASVVLAAVRG